MKQCFKCRKVKPLDEFYRHPQMGDGYLGKCKDCTKRDTQLNYRVRLEQYHEYDRERYQEPVRRAQSYHQTVKQRARHPEKARAYGAVSRAVRNGRLTRGPCEICGTTVKVEAHHTDYSKPLDVRWLCRTHHRAVEGRLVTPLPF